MMVTDTTKNSTEPADPEPAAPARYAADSSVLEEWVDVAIHVDQELGLVRFCYRDRHLMLLSDDIDAVAAAAADSQDSPQWCEKYGKLLIPSTRTGAGNRFFSLTRMES
jgi:hypothetical protein